MQSNTLLGLTPLAFILTTLLYGACYTYVGVAGIYWAVSIHGFSIIVMCMLLPTILDNRGY